MSLVNEVLISLVLIQFVAWILTIEKYRSQITDNDVTHRRNVRIAEKQYYSLGYHQGRQDEKKLNETQINEIITEHIYY